MSASAFFWFIAGLLCAVALMLLARPWLRSATSLRALPGSLPGWLPAAAAVLVAAVLALYLSLGSPEQAETAGSQPAPHALSGVAAAGSAGAADASSMESVLASLESRLKSGGGSDADWDLLAKSYEFLNRAADAALAREHKLPAGAGMTTPSAQPVTLPAAAAPVLTAAGKKLLEGAEAARRQRDYAKARDLYRQAAQQQQMTADTWADYADVSASLNGNSLVGEPEQHIQRALQLDPRHAKALWLQGSVEHQTQRHVAAMATWKKLLAVMDPASSDAKLIAANLAEDEQLAGGKTIQANAAAGVAIRGEVTISDALKAKVQAGTTLFILAKSVNSPGAPVAVIRTATGMWPVKFELNDSQAMVPGHNLSSAGKVTVEARISKSGQAASQPGDLSGTTVALDPAAGKAVSIVISKEVG